jgi:hypothetical protein
MSDGIAPANPTVNHTQSVDRIGSDATGTETAAESFTQFLENEGKPDPQSRPARRANAEKRARKADDDGAGEADEGQGRERQPKGERSERRQESEPEGDAPEVDPLHDPVLDGDAPEEDGDNPDDTDADEDADEVDPDAEGDDDEGDEDPEFEVTVNGEKKSVKQSELLASYSREADYRQKTEVLARDVEQVHEFATALTARRTEADNLVQMAEDLLQAILPKDEDWQVLRQKDPNAFIAAQEQWQGFINQATKLRQAREAQNGQQGEEDGVKYGNYVKEQNRLLFDKVPALRNPKVQKQFSETIFAYGKKMGYTPEELAKGLVNHRDVQTAYYAARYLQILESRKAQSKQAAKKGPRQSEGNSTPRTPQSQRGRDNSRRMNRQRDADRELQRTGSPQSAAKAFAAMFRE